MEEKSASEDWEDEILFVESEELGVTLKVLVMNNSASGSFKIIMVVSGVWCRLVSVLLGLIDSVMVASGISLGPSKCTDTVPMRACLKILLRTSKGSGSPSKGGTQVCSNPSRSLSVSHH